MLCTHADVRAPATSSQREWYKVCNILRIAKSGRDTRTYADLSTSLASHSPGSTASGFLRSRAPVLELPVLELPVLELPILDFVHVLESLLT